MLTLVSGAIRTVRTADVGHLVVPKQWNHPNALGLEPGKWAMDNGAFSGFDHGAFVRMLEAFKEQPGCLFISSPDVVADAAATLALWPFWSQLIRGIGRRPAFVLQDGMEHLTIPDCEAIFVGGSTKFKESSFVRSVCAFSRASGRWVHWGRVNGKRRYELALLAGAQSIDGTGFSMYPDTNIPKVAQWDAEIASQPLLEV